MPNFHLHWLVAWQALDAIPGRAQAGRNAYLGAARKLRRGVYEDLKNVRHVEDVHAFFEDDLPNRLARWRNELDRPPGTGAGAYSADDVTCFSAFMLGACGPDFWMVASLSGTGTLPDFGSQHFDLGHYNRTHQQFRVSVAELSRRTAGGIQEEAERSYFLGMATHVAADVVLHQLVNVYAGAYNLLEKTWNNEHEFVRIAGFQKNLWNTHNKVEQFWDSYVRYRYLGDLALEEGVFADDRAGWVEPLGFPVAETLVAAARRIEDPAARNAMLARLVSRDPGRHRGKTAGVGGEAIAENVRIALEIPLLFPALACDRILDEWETQKRLVPFIYDRVVEKDRGAYPEAHVYKDAVKEKRTLQMADDSGRGGRSESRKLRYFSTRRNLDPPHWSGQSYMNYRISPDLARLRETGTAEAVRHLAFGRNAFYDLEALRCFGERAVEVAKSFATKLAAAYQDRNPDALGDVARFWNLDTGLGFEVQNVASHTDRELLTRLDLVHVFDPRLAVWAGAAGDPAYGRGPAARGALEYLDGKAANREVFSKVEEPAFPVRTASAGGPQPDGIATPFEALSKVKEPDTKAFLDRIRLVGAPATRLRDLKPAQVQEKPNQTWSERREARTQAWLDAFFAEGESPRSWRHPFATVSEDAKRRFELQTVKHRLTLELRVPVVDLGGGDGVEPAMLFYCDHRIGLRDAYAGERKEWLANAKLVGYATKPDQQWGPLRAFTARILVNFEEEDEREIELGKWNNVVPYQENKGKRFYGRNFAVATGRRHVLHPTGTGLFDPTADFEHHANVSPTEHVFFTLYPLVRTAAGVFDAFSKETVTRQDFDEIRKITGLEWKKVVLFYDLRDGAAAQLRRCFVDALDVDVVGAET